MGGGAFSGLGRGVGEGVDCSGRQGGIDDVRIVGIEECDAVCVGERGVAAFEIFGGGDGVVLGLGDGGFGCGGGTGWEKVEYGEV